MPEPKIVHSNDDTCCWPKARCRESAATSGLTKVLITPSGELTAANWGFWLIGAIDIILSMSLLRDERGQIMMVSMPTWSLVRCP